MPYIEVRVPAASRNEAYPKSSSSSRFGALTSCGDLQPASPMMGMVGRPAADRFITCLMLDIQSTSALGESTGSPVP